jgi:hypothetical protein
MMGCMTDNRIPCPPFDLALFTLMDVVLDSPQQTSRHAYIDATGEPFDLAGHVLDRLGAPIRTAAEGHLDHHVIAKAKAGIPGTPRAIARFPMLWDRLFLRNEADGSPAPYDSRFTMFWDMQHNRDGSAEQYLVYALFGHLVNPQGRGRYDLLNWAGEALRGVKSFRRFLLSPSSGFLVQTHGGQKDLLEYVDRLTKSAEADLTHTVRQLS